MNVLRQVVSVILVFANLICTTGCTMFGYNLGKGYDLKHGELESIPLDSIYDGITIGDEVMIELESSEIIQGPITYLDEHHLTIRYVDRKSASEPIINAKLSYDSIQKISVIRPHSKMRYLGVSIGVVLDIFLALAIYALTTINPAPTS